MVFVYNNLLLGSADNLTCVGAKLVVVVVIDLLRWRRKSGLNYCLWLLTSLYLIAFLLHLLFRDDYFHVWCHIALIISRLTMGDSPAGQRPSYSHPSIAYYTGDGLISPYHLPSLPESSLLVLVAYWTLVLFCCQVWYPFIAVGLVRFRTW